MSTSSEGNGPPGQAANLSSKLKVTVYSLLLRMRGVRLRFTVNSEMCA